MSSQDLSSYASSSLGSEEEEPGDDEGGVAVAQPPRGTSPHTAEVALGMGDALEILGQLVSSNQLGKERAARLRRRYNHLREALDSSRSVESSLLIEAKDLGQHLSQQQHLLKRGGTFPDGENSETMRLRQILLQHQNELDRTQERVEKLNYHIQLLEEEKAEVDREWSRMPKKEEVEQHMRELQRQVDELRDEISLRSKDIRRYHEDLDRRTYRLTNILQDVEEIGRQEEGVQDQLIQLRASGNIPREINAIRKQKKDIEGRIRELESFLGELGSQRQEVEKRVSAVVDELRQSRLGVAQIRGEVQSSEVDLDRVNKDTALSREREASLLEERATMELHTRHRTGEQRTLFEAVSKKTKEKDKDLKLLKKAELQLNALRQSLDQQKRQCFLLEERVREGSMASERAQARREDVGTEVETLRKDLAQQVGVEGVYREGLEARVALDGKMKLQLRRQQTLLHDLSRDVVTVTKARDRDAREYYKGQRQDVAIAHDLKTKSGQLQEQRKRLGDLENRLKDFAEAYEVVKSERNKTHAQIQTMTQLATELSEKAKILQNEIDILTSSAEKKDKILQKCSLVHTAKVMERDSQRQDLSKVKLSQAEVNSSLESLREELHKLTQQASATEQQLVRLRRHYEQAVQERNDLGLQLIERNEEVCVFYEKINVQDSVLRKANMELTNREEEDRFLTMELSGLQNNILVQRKHLPEKGRLESELVASQIELKACEEQLRALEAAVECASDPSRLRLLSGTDPTTRQIRDRTEKLESLLAEKEQQLLEKELLYDQVCKLTERSQTRVGSQRESTLAVAKKVNQYQSKIKDTTRKMMALVSELSMRQAKALRLHQEARESEVRVEQAYARLEAGDPPDEHTAADWQRTLRVEEMRGREAETRLRAMEAEESRMLPGGVVTTAEPRPNAYIPSSETDLPLPKPYGSHAPFKPTQPGSTIRHIRKPEPKRIDI